MQIDPLSSVTFKTRQFRLPRISMIWSDGILFPSSPTRSLPTHLVEYHSDSLLTLQTNTTVASGGHTKVQIANFALGQQTQTTYSRVGFRDCVAVTVTVSLRKLWQSTRTRAQHPGYGVLLTARLHFLPDAVELGFSLVSVTTGRKNLKIQETSKKGQMRPKITITC